MTLLLAEWVAPIAGPLIYDGAVAVEHGRVVEVGPRGYLRGRYPNAVAEDYAGCLLLPGLVNAHAHLELSELTLGERPARFVNWLRRVVAHTAGVAESEVARAFSKGVDESLRFGVTAVGDITRFPSITRPLLGDRPLRITSFGEITAMGRRRGLLEERVAAALVGEENDRLTIGISPHSPYSVEYPGYQRCAKVPRPLATHLAESPDEAEFLRDLAGPFRELWDGLPWFDEEIPRFSDGPIRMAEAAGILARPSVLAHVNYCDDAEMELLRKGHASVVYCPRTHAYFGHPPHRWREMLEAGINVAVGTDSKASSPDLNLVDDLRLMHHLAPEVPAETLWRMATLNGATALRRPEVGAIAAGLMADFVVFEVKTQDPLREVLEEQVLPRETLHPITNAVS